ncbi:MAG: NAD(+) synthase [Nitrososphaeria archaeon]|nr:NAD(+) synthase [Nitrososphaeria archaeon]NIN51771.1 NAD(+) synthase [Nitrososphaeria archaeon]NIQ32276.1 NAD(+) synthase [Nitrososphaeria archaeon]
MVKEISRLRVEIRSFEPIPYVNSMTQKIKEYFNRSGATGILTGIDGELDSSVAALLCSRAVTGSKIHAIYLMDKKTHSQVNLRYVNRVAKIGRFNLSVVEITPLNRSVLKSLPQIKRGRMSKSDLAAKAVSKNLSARIRMMSLYYYANLYRYIVCGVLDKSEWLLGSFTKWGDGSADIMPLASLYKTQVGMVAKALKVGFIAKKHPMTKLLNDRPSHHMLPNLYEDLDPILLGIEKGWENQEIADDIGTDLEGISETRSIVEKNWHRRHGSIIL